MSLVTLSIVSHGQGELIALLLNDLRSIQDCGFEVILTLNIPEDEGYIEAHSDLPIRVIRNKSVKGFGANHNQAFTLSNGDPFVVVNPDIRLRQYALKPLMDVFACTDVGASAPVVFSSSGLIQDSARKFPTYGQTLRRIFLGAREIDYQWMEGPIAVDWVAGMFVAFRRIAFAAVDGFDENYFMYFEDADICRRLLHKGWRTILQPAYEVTHDAQRASRRSLRHLRWQVRSCIRFLTRY